MSLLRYILPPVLGILGAVAGAFIGQPLIGGALGVSIGGAIGGALGGAIGTVVGGLAFPLDPTIIRGSRLGDLTVTGSAYGLYIGQTYGTVRINGNMIWATPIDQKKQTDTVSSSGKGVGGASTKTILFSYFGNFAIAFGRGPAVAVLRIWADTKLIFDATGSKITKKKHLRFRFYPGDEEQLPDPLIEHDRGVGNVPGHRGLVLIVFEKMPLADYGNRMPSITAEIAFATTPAQPVVGLTVLSGPSTSFTEGLFAVDWARSAGYLMDEDGDGGPYIRRFNVDSMVEDLQVATDDHVHVHGPMRVMGDGSLLTTVFDALTQVGRTEPDSLLLTGISVPGLVSSPTDAAPISAIAPDGAMHFAMVLSDDGTATIFNWGHIHDDPLYLWGPSVPVAAISRGAVAELVGEGWWITSALELTRVRVAYDAVFDLIGLVTSGVTTDLITTLAGSGTVACLIYVAGDDSVIAAIDGGSPGTRLVKVASDGSVQWTTRFATVPPASFSQSDTTGAALWWAASKNVYGVSLVSGAVLANGQSWSATAITDSPEGAYSALYDSILVVGGPPADVTMAYVGRAVGAGTTLGAIVADVCNQVGLGPGDVDVGALTQPVKGYVISRETDARSVLVQLSGAWFFDGVESDEVLRFVMRTNDSAGDIPELDLASTDQQTNVLLPETRTNEVELPRRLTVRYLAKENDYQAGAQTAQRIALPRPAAYSAQDAAVDLPIVLSGTEALQIGERTLFAGWLERSSFAARLPWRYAKYDPTDVVTFVMKSGLEVPVRLLRLDVGADLSLDVGGVSADGPVYDPSAIEGTGQTSPGQTILTDAPTRLLLPDLPLLRDADDAGGAVSIAYCMAGSYGASGWPGCTVLLSADGITYADAALLPNEVAYGVVLDFLPNVDDPFVTDRANAIRVRMITGAGSLASVSTLEMLNGANAAALGGEIVQFRDATLNGDGSWTLSTLLRGRRGTDWKIWNHNAGELLILLSSNTAERVPLDLAAVGATRWWKGVTFGAFAEDAVAIAATHSGNDLKPYAVVHLAAAMSGSDIVLSWVRRTRLGGAMIDGLGEVPLHEQTESYEADIYDPIGGGVFRTLTSATPTVTYLAADIATDFGTPPATLNVLVYQISAAVGRGFAGPRFTIPVAA